MCHTAKSFLGKDTKFCSINCMVIKKHLITSHFRNGTRKGIGKDGSSNTNHSQFPTTLR